MTLLAGFCVLLWGIDAALWAAVAGLVFGLPWLIGAALIGTFHRKLSAF